MVITSQFLFLGYFPLQLVRQARKSKDRTDCENVSGATRVMTWAVVLPPVATRFRILRIETLRGAHILVEGEIVLKKVTSLCWARKRPEFWSACSGPSFVTDLAAISPPLNLVRLRLQQIGHSEARL